MQLIEEINAGITFFTPQDEPPEVQLWRAVLFRAMLDAKLARKVKFFHRKNKHLRDADVWVDDEEFSLVCRFAQVNEEEVKKAFYE